MWGSVWNVGVGVEKCWGDARKRVGGCGGRCGKTCGEMLGEAWESLLGCGEGKEERCGKVCRSVEVGEGRCHRHRSFAVM